MGSLTASSRTPLGSTSRSARMVDTYCSMMSVVAAPAVARHDMGKLVTHGLDNKLLAAFKRLRGTQHEPRTLPGLAKHFYADNRLSASHQTRVDIQVLVTIWNKPSSKRLVHAALPSRLHAGGASGWHG